MNLVKYIYIYIMQVYRKDINRDIQILTYTSLGYEGQKENYMLERIKEIVSEVEMKEIDRVLEEIYSIDDQSNNSVAVQLGFYTVANLNGNGYNNLVLIAASLNYGKEDKAFARFILSKVITDKQIEALALELLKNETNYKTILWPY